MAPFNGTTLHLYNHVGILSPERWQVLISLKVLALLYIFMRALLEVQQLFTQNILNFIFSIENLAEIAQYLSSASFLFLVTSSGCYCASAMAWQSGVISVTLSCLVLILWTEIIPWIGIYVIVMKKIVYSFLKVTLFGSLLIIAFGLIFYMLFSGPPKGVSYSSVL